MTLSPPLLSAAELATRLELRKDAGDWLAYLAPDAQAVSLAAADLLEELRRLTLSVEQVDNPKDAAALIRSAGETDGRILLLTGLETFSAAEWRRLDLRRDELARSCCVLLIVTRDTLARILTEAPNLSSWISGSLWSWERDTALLTDEETEQRLAALRARMNHTDEEVIRMAQTGHLPRDPEYGEWLVLLNRGDLL